MGLTNTPLQRAAAAIRAEIQCGEADAMIAARAVLRAIREPSAEMVDAAAPHHRGWLDDDELASAFKAMIDAAMDGE